MLKIRIVSACILMPLVILLISYLPLFIFIIINIAVCMLAAWEWGLLAGIITHGQRAFIAMLYGFILLIMVYILQITQNNLQQFEIQAFLWVSIIWWFSAFILVSFYPSSAGLWRNSRLLRLLFGMFILIPFFLSIILLRIYTNNIKNITGTWWLLIVMFLVWSADSGAYIFGRYFGKHLLAPKISPGKTWEGLFAGLLFSTIIAWLFSLLAPFNNIKISMLFFFSIIIVLTSVLGDLTESMFKREAGIKNSGNLIPGHGGILDRIDSLTSAVPILVYLLLIFRFF
ncbi:phosphatidate cytidylyltransferase [Pantoea sp. Mhis]|uniref:phosphatidate cytidylyltransferase n=1 Tax=Pantoea sp. Mhis TaxID=2576759 RepID=UPI0013599670|nr:phosphatidate cytidylyltransferase [Pantoea sp. Mhis]MXP56354.1 phosphatidate cytidylyltransferase [Pantoea sp. Mhis]